jgi:PTH2 family peptidyl-tRNA hydrolase
MLSMSKMKQVIVMRKDLNMRKGKMIAQGAHASLKAVIDKLDDPQVKEWLDGLFTKICVSVNSKEELFEVYDFASTLIYYNKNNDKMIVPCAIIEDSGLTEFNGVPTYTCCAIGPAEDTVIDQITGNLKLL